jgi:hypothetical protein
MISPAWRAALRDGAVYPLSPEGLAEALTGFVREFGVGLVGGCCGTTDEHIRQDSSVLMIGGGPTRTAPRPSARRCWKGRFDDCVEIARDQTRDGAHAGEVDVIPFTLATMGQPIADYANELFAANSYRDYLEVHGLGVQLTEALAEHWHRRVREELRFAGGAAAAEEDPDDVEEFFELGYRGARFPGLRRLPEPGGPGEDRRAAPPGADRREAVGRVPAVSRTVDRRDRLPPPGGEVFQHLIVKGEP